MDFIRDTYEAFENGALATSGEIEAVALSAYIGTDDEPGPLHLINSPRVFVVTPFTIPFDRTGATGVFRYEARANYLAQSLTSLLRSPYSGEVYGYTPAPDPEISKQEFHYLGRTILEVDMQQSILRSSSQRPNDPGLFMAQWRFWVEDQLITTHDFVAPPLAAAHAGLQKREDDPMDQCLVMGGSAGKTSANPTTATSMAEEMTTTGETTSETTNAISKTTSGVPTAEKTTTAGETTTAPPTTLKTSFITTTSSADPTTIDSFTGPYPCVIKGGPRVETAHCMCSTTSDGESFVTTAPLISGKCTQYHEYPGSPTKAPPASPPDPTPFTLTMDNGAILAYTDQAEQIGVYPGGSYTYTLGKGTPSTIRPADPEQTASNNDGSFFCGDIDDACDRAVEKFDDDTIYKKYTTRVAFINDVFVNLVTFGQSVCQIKFDCGDWEKGGLNGKQIKDAYKHLKDTTNVTKCGARIPASTTAAPRSPRPTALARQLQLVDIYPGGKYTHTDGKGTPSTIRPPTPKATGTDDFDKESCYDLKDSCDRAASRFIDDFRYTDVAFYSSTEKRAIPFIPIFGSTDNGCSIIFSCKDYSKGGMTGKLVKDAYAELKKDTKCGTIYMDNSCAVVAQYCDDCYNEHQKTD
ncbi:hypothetical protein IL306_014205 [Fusarium sp. DS 682]|nr:hypothetical protein IL306_014205 [Fusarium sp. DS 682]